jgi:hypothetical protein
MGYLSALPVPDSVPIYIIREKAIPSFLVLHALKFLSKPLVKVALQAPQARTIAQPRGYYQTRWMSWPELSLRTTFSSA